jgi:glucoamylase
VVGQAVSPFFPWRFDQRAGAFPAGKQLRIETLAPTRVHWSGDGWKTVRDVVAVDTGLGVFVADLPTAALPAGAGVVFTFFWPGVDRWEGTDFSITVGSPAA